MFECNRKERFKCIQINKKEDYKDLIDINEVLSPLRYSYKPNAKWVVKTPYEDRRFHWRKPIAPGDWIVEESDGEIPFRILSDEEFHKEYSIIEEDKSCFNV